MAPLATLPFALAAAIFVAASLLVLGAVVAAWLPLALPRRAHRPARLALALGAGFYPAVAGSIFAGQANLLVLGLLAVGLQPVAAATAATRDRTRPLTPGHDGARPLTPGEDGPCPRRAERHGGGRALAGGLALGLAAVVKLVPLALAAPLALAGLLARPARTPRRNGGLRPVAVLAGLVVGFVGALALAAAIAPWSVRGQQSLAELFRPDAYWTNQSITGAISRLLSDGDRTAAVVHASPTAWIVLATAVLAAATAWALWVGRERLRTPTGLARALALALVAATLGAPKTSFWNHALVLPAIVLLVLAEQAAPPSDTPSSGGPIGRLLGLGGPALLALAAWLAGAAIEAIVDPLVGPVAGPLALLRTVLSTAATVGLLGPWLLLTRRLVAPATGAEAERAPTDVPRRTS